VNHKSEYFTERLKAMKIIISNKLTIQEATGTLKRQIIDKLTFINPKWLENNRLGYWNGDTPQYQRFYEIDNGVMVIPRGYCRQLIDISRLHGISYEIEDNRQTLPGVEFTFNGQLEPFQKDAVSAMVKKDFGTLSAPTGSGKTVIALNLIAERKQPALIILHTKELLNQWIERIGGFLGIPANEVGVIGNGKRALGNKISVALVQTLYKCADEVAPHTGYFIVDECHRTPSRTFTEAVTAFNCRYMMGLSATPWRRDKLSRLIFWHLGDVVHEIKKEALIKTKDILPIEAVIRETNFKTLLDPSEEYSRMLSELTEDPERNLLIAADVAREAKNGGGVCLVLSDRKAHCEALSRLLVNSFKTPCDILTGDLNKKQRETVVDRLNHGRVRVLIATGQLIGEGFDCKSLSTLFIATPIKFNGRVLQYVGRVLRPAPDKDKAKVYDYVDSNVGVLVTAAKVRARVYGEEGIILMSI